MQLLIPREIRDNLTRAAGYLRRNDVHRALENMCTGLRAYAHSRLLPLAAKRVQRQIQEFLSELTQQPSVQPLLSVIPYKPGQESSLAVVLSGLAKILAEDSAEQKRKKIEDRLTRKKNLLQSGLEALHKGQDAVGIAFLKRIAVEFEDEEGICLQIGQLLASAGQERAAALMFEEAMQRQPRVPTGYVQAVNLWLKLADYPRAEAVYQASLRTLGGHPNTFVKMAQMYLAWGKKDKAKDMAERTLSLDPNNKDAQDLLKLC